jgi:hypothetical protein
MIGQCERGAVGDEEHPRAMAVRGHGCSDRIPGETVERGIADGFPVGSEAVLVLPPRLAALKRANIYLLGCPKTG